MPLINPKYIDAFSDNPYREEIDTRSDLEIELDNMIDPFASTVNFPEWTTEEDRIREYTDDYGSLFVPQGVPTMGPHGSPWAHMGPHGWVSHPHGSPWVFMGSPWGTPGWTLG